MDWDGLVVDLDGVVWLAGAPIDGASEAIAELRAKGLRLLFLTNDPASSRAELAARLSELGIAATEDDVMTSAVATARFLAAQERLAGCDVLAVGSQAFRLELEAVGFRLLPLERAPDARVVAVSGHPGFDYEELRAATTAVLGGAELYATGRDAVYPTSDGPLPATGAIVAAIETATATRATVIGKPEPYVFEVARAALAGCERVAVVGDHLDADIAGAKRAGLAGVLVLTGNTSEAEVAAAAVAPDLVLASITELPGALS